MTLIRFGRFVAAGLMFAATYANADTSAVDGATDAAADAADSGNEVVVTGYRGESRTVADSLVPIDVLTQDALQATAKRDLRTALTELVPSLNTSMSGSGTGRGNLHATLRGLSGNETLILVNGKRWHGSSLVATTVFGASPADLGLIPLSQVERVEVLRDGAAAQYGSDAIAGVINIILKSKSTGSYSSALFGSHGPDEGDSAVAHRGQTATLLTQKGFQLGQSGFLSLGLDVTHQESSNAVGPTRDNYRIYPLLPDGEPDPREFSTSRSRYITGLPRESRAALGYNLELPLNEAVSLYSFGSTAYRRNLINGSYRAPNNLLGAAVVDIYPDGYMSALRVKQSDYQSVAGLKGEAFDWSWDASLSFANDDAKLYTEGTANPSLGPTSPTAFYNGKLVLEETIVNLNANRPFETTWFSAPLRVATGLEYRNTEWEQGAGEVLSYLDGGYVIPSGPFAGQVPTPGTGFQSGFAPDQSGRWSRQNSSFYVDFSQEITDRWELSLAGRYEYYSTFNGTTSGKLSTRYEITPAIAVRGTVSTGFAAPSLQQEHYRYNQPQYQTNVTTGVVTKTGSRFVGVDDPTGIALGATALKPEKSTNYSVGFNYRLNDRSNIAIDAYRIDIRDRIRLSSQFDGTTNATVRAALIAAGQDFNQQVYYFTNIGDTRTQGIDLVADYTANYGRFGNVKWTLASNQSRQELTEIAPTPDVLANAGLVMVGRDAVGQITEAYPKNKTSLGANWSLGPTNVDLRATRYSQVALRALQGPSRDTIFDPKTVVNLDVGHWFSEALRVSAGANNLFDTRPSVVSPAVLAVNGNFLAQPFYSEGSPFGYNGVFYYARLEARF